MLLAKKQEKCLAELIGRCEHLSRMWGLFGEIRTGFQTRTSMYLGTKYQNGNKCTKCLENIPKGYGISIPIGLKIPKGHEIYPKFQFQGLPKYTKIRILGVQIPTYLYHLVTLLQTTKEGLDDPKTRMQCIYRPANTNMLFYLQFMFIVLAYIQSKYGNV
jgi:hypothetical protein